MVRNIIIGIALLLSWGCVATDEFVEPTRDERVADDAAVAADAGRDTPTPDAGNPADVGAADFDEGLQRPPEGERVDLLPVEVIGPPGTTASVIIDVPADAPVGSDATLRLAIHNIVESESAAVWVNEHGPYDLDARESEGGFMRGRGGAVAGRLALDAEAVRSGENVVTFAYTRQVDDVSGFRVLDVGIELDGRRFDGPSELDDPTSWDGFSADAESISRGERFFGEVSRDGGPVCATCHADSGADLEYYAFSNRSIVARAMFHEFTREEAEDIASYIRSLDVPREGRVYEPPFQPGPGNVAAAGAGLDAISPADADVGAAVFGSDGEVPQEWSWAADVDTFTVPSTLEVPTWFRWLPRFIDAEWFELRGGALADARDRLAAEPSLENAHEFMSAAVAVGKQVMVLYGDHAGRIELLRYAAVKLWDWSRKQGFGDPDHGFPDDTYGDEGHRGSPAYPYEVGFAFFEAAAAGHPDAMEQAIEWWVVQVALDPGRGRSNGNRPLDYRDVLLAAESNVGPMELTWLYLLGSWEESRGAMSDSWGTPTGPARLLQPVLPVVSPEIRTSIWLRHLAEETNRAVPLGPEHHSMLADAWETSCSELSPGQRSTVRAAAPTELKTNFEACP